MTVVSAVAVPIPRTGQAGPEPATPRLALGPAVEIVVVLAIVGWWAIPLTHGSGGRDVGSLTVATGLAAVALLAVRPWRFLGWRVPALGAAVAGAALGVCVLSPGGWAGGDVAAGYVLAAACTVVALGWLRAGGASRPDLLVGAFLVAGIDQAGRTIISWVHGGDPSVLLNGTFYWHNPFAAFLLPVALVALATIIWTSGPVRILAWLAAPLSVTGVVLSSSRATLGCLVVSWGIVGLIACARPRFDRRRSLRWLLASTVSAALVVLLPGPPFFSDRVSPLAAAGARAARGETVASNTGYRIQFWHEAVNVAIHHPVTGAGYRTLGTASVAYTPAGWARSPWAHNGYLQPLADGGLLLGVPFLAAIALVGIAAVRRLRPAFTASAGDDAVHRSALAVALLAALAHTGVDFDWSYPSILVEAGLLSALVLGSPLRSAQAPPERGRVRGASLVAVALIAALAAGATVVGAARMRTDDAITRARQSPLSDQPAMLAAAGRAPLAGVRPWRLLLAAAVPTTVTQGLQIAPELASEALRRTAEQAGIEPQLAAERAEIQALLGNVQGARQSLDRVRSIFQRDTGVAVWAIPALAASGLRSEADRLGGHELVALADARDANVRLVAAALRQADGDTLLTRCAAVLASEVVADPASPHGSVPPDTDCRLVLSGGST